MQNPFREKMRNFREIERRELCKPWIRILMGVHHALRDQFSLYSASCKEKIDVDEAIF